MFADTDGYHKGGLARDRDRILYACAFTSQAAQHGDSFTRPGKVSIATDSETAFALAIQAVTV